MASTSGKVLQAAANMIARNIAGKQARESKKEGTWAALKAILKPVAGYAGKGLVSMLGVTNPYLLPLLYGTTTAGISKIVDYIGRKAGMGADPSKVQANGKYGLGEKESLTIRERLEQDIKDRDPFSKESIGADILMSYISAITPKIGIDPKTGGFKIEGGELSKENIAKWKAGKAAKSLAKARESVPTSLEESFDIPSEIPIDGSSEELWSPGKGWETPLPISEQGPQQSPQSFSDKLSGLTSRYLTPGKGISLEHQKEYEDALEEYKMTHDLSRDFGASSVPYYEQGGRVPTIADYFGRQDKTLGGSNKQSIGQMLRRR